MRKIEVTTAFKRDFKRESKGQHRAILDTELKDVIALLAGDMPLPAKLRDHALTGNWKDYRDCHVRPDLVLIYRRFNADEGNPRRLVLARLGSHSQLDL